KVKRGKITKIPIGKCRKISVESLLKKGYTVSKVTTTGNKTKIESFSPMTMDKARRSHTKRLGGIPF
ncbi:MAG: hypothetical protein JXB42_00185, partial [Deltaproteobacteria bacterium]|nr:hypothetical protein [Deltaproteobacteria bacterium]